MASSSKTPEITGKIAPTGKILIRYDGFAHKDKSTELQDFFSKEVGECMATLAHTRKGQVCAGITLLTFANVKHAAQAASIKKAGDVGVYVYSFDQQGQVFVCFEEKDDAEFVLVVEHLTRREISLGKGRIHPVIEEEESDDEKAFI